MAPVAIQRCVRVIDVKTPGSGESARNRLENFTDVRASDQFKFVICDRHDFEWALEFTDAHRLDEQADVLLSPSFGQLEASELAGWLLDSGRDLRLQVQLHKALWGEERGR